MKLLIFCITAVVYSGIALDYGHGQTHNRFGNFEKPTLHCELLTIQSDRVKKDYDNLKSHLLTAEESFEQQQNENNKILEQFQNFEKKLLEMQVILKVEQQKHFKKLKDVIGSLNHKNVDSDHRCNGRSSLINDMQKFSKSQNAVAKRFDIEMELEAIPQAANDASQIHFLERDYEHFCGEFYTKTLEDVSGNMTVLQNIDQKLEKVSKKLLKQSEKHKNSIEAMPDVIRHLDTKDESGVCVRIKDKSTICSNQPLPASCLQYASPYCLQGICLIQNFIYGPDPFLVSCDQLNEGGGWIVMQRRINGSVDFYRNWSEYKMGFGDLDGEFWLGLDKLHALTTALAPVELLIQLKDHRDITKYAKYSEFLIGNETELYKLKKAKGYEGNAGDSFSPHKGQKFTTWDMDNDASYSYNCAVEKIGAWWYGSCLWSNLNGLHYNKGKVPRSESGQGICWGDFHGYRYSMKSVQMMIRPKKYILSDMDLL